MIVGAVEYVPVEYGSLNVILATLPGNCAVIFAPGGIQTLGLTVNV